MPTRAFIFISIALLAGIIAGSLLVTQIIWIALPAVFALLFLPRARVIIILAGAALALGYFRGGQIGRQFDYFQSFGGKSIQTKALVDDVSQRAGYEIVNVHDSSFRYEVFSKETLHPNELITVTGKLEAPSPPWDRYSYARGLLGTFFYPKIKPIGSLAAAPDIFRRIKNSIEGSLNASLSPDEAAFATGLLLGDKTDISPDLKQSLVQTGTMHLIALSGYNITLIIGFLAVALSFLPLRTRTATSILAIFLFLAVTGFSPSAIRAALMGVAMLAEPYVGRARHQLAILLAVGSAMALVNPWWLTGDPGFQLSFAATAGIIIMTPHLLTLMRGLPKLLSEGLATTLAAQIATLPLSAWYFGQLSPAAPLVNMIVLPLVPLATAASAISAAANLVPTLGPALAHSAGAAVRLPLTMIELSSRYSPLITVSAAEAGAVSLFAAAFLVTRRRHESEA